MQSGAAPTQLESKLLPSPEGTGDAIPQESSNGFLIPTIDFGMYYNTRTFYAGFSAEHLNQSSFLYFQLSQSLLLIP